MQMTRIFSTITMDYMEAFGNNSSVKSVRELQVMRSFWQTADENMAISQPLKRCNKRHITYHRGRDYTVQVKQRKKKKITEAVCVFGDEIHQFWKMPKQQNGRFRMTLK